MKTIHAILALCVATLLVSAFSFAAEPEHEIKHQIKIKIDDGDEMIAIDADDLEIGETRQSFTESGKEVLLTRTEEGMELSVDGEEIDLGFSHGDAHHAMFFSGDEDSKVVIRSMGGEEGHKYAFIHGDGDGENHWVQKGEDGEDIDIFIERFSPANHLLESGVLDDLDEETRQEILDTLGEMEPHKRIHKKVLVEVDERIHKKDGDED